MKKSAACVGSIEQKSEFISIKSCPKPKKKLHCKGWEREETGDDIYLGRFEAINFWEENLLSRLTNRYLVNI